MSSSVGENKDKQYKITVIDKLLAATFLKLLPKTVTPNQITLLRFLLIPLVGWLFYRHFYGWGLVVFLVTMFTDALDGAMARTRNQITDLGKVIDPVADKLAIATVMIFLVKDLLSWQLAAIIIVIDILILIIGGYKRYVLRQEIQAEFFGKSKLILQVIGVSLLLVYILCHCFLALTLAKIILIGAIIFALISLWRPYSI